MTQRIINDTFWTDPYIEDLDPTEKLIFLYLLTNPLCNIAGAYEIRTNRIAYETGYDKDMINKILLRFKKDNKIMRSGDWIILINFAKNQTKNPNVKIGMQRVIDGIPEEIVKALKGFERLPYFTLLNLTLPNFTLLDSTEVSTEVEIPYFQKLMKEKFDEGFIEKLNHKYQLPTEDFKEQCELFFIHWTEKSENGRKERWEMEKTFDIQRRFYKWLSNNKKWSNSSNKIKSRTAGAGHKSVI